MEGKQYDEMSYNSDDELNTTISWADPLVTSVQTYEREEEDSQKHMTRLETKRANLLSKIKYEHSQPIVKLRRICIENYMVSSITDVDQEGVQEKTCVVTPPVAEKTSSRNPENNILNCSVTITRCDDTFEREIRTTDFETPESRKPVAPDIKNSSVEKNNSGKNMQKPNLNKEYSKLKQRVTPEVKVPKKYVKQKSCCKYSENGIFKMNHASESTKRKAYKCNLCRRYSSQKYKMILHLIFSHGSQTSAKCEICGICFKKKNDLLEHYSKHYKIKTVGEKNLENLANIYPYKITMAEYTDA